MGQTPDRFPGPLVEEEVRLEESTTDPTVVGAIRNVSGDIKMRDATGVFNARSGTGLTEAAHRTLRQLIHFIDDGPAEGFASLAYRETLPTASPFPTSIIWYDDATKAKKLVERLLTWTGVNLTTDVWKVYDTDGSTVLATVTDAISYSGVFETSRTRTIA